MVGECGVAGVGEERGTGNEADSGGSGSVGSGDPSTVLLSKDNIITV